ncbi:MAG: penicillin-binding protein 2, partial [Rhodovibrionaceae bacterium]
MAERRKNADRNEEASRYKVFSRRALLFGGVQTLMLSALAGRMYYLQVLQSDQYSLLAEDNRINLRLLPPPRGRIIDRFGVPLAVNEQNYRVLIVEEQARDVDGTLALLDQVIEIDQRDIERIKRELGRKRGFVPITVQENLTWKQVSQLEVNAPDLPGVSIDVGQTRHYPYGAAMSHLVGYVGAVSERDLTGEPLLELPGFRIGKNGAEKMHENQLRGSAGASQVEVNAIGRIIKEVDRQEGAPGRDVVLTIDAGLQTYTHQRLMGERSASAVILDVQNGEVMALASTPSYDPTPFNTGLTGQQWSDLVNDPLSPLSNKAISGTYAPGSTFKMMVALAALEDGISASHQAWCPGHMTLGNHRFHCWKRYGHGWMGMHDAIEQSCDVYFYDIARKLGVDKIAAMSRRFGLGAPVGLDLPGERGGVIPTRDWKLAYMGEAWQGGETLVTAIGQGFVLTTPLQLAVMAARIANGGKAVVPRITRGILPGDAGPGQNAENPAELVQPQV